jgi:hypothetical protein
VQFKLIMFLFVGGTEFVRRTKKCSEKELQVKCCWFGSLLREICVGFVAGSLAPTPNKKESHYYNDEYVICIPTQQCSPHFLLELHPP